MLFTMQSEFDMGPLKIKVFKALFWEGGMGVTKKNMHRCQHQRTKKRDRADEKA